MQARDDKIQDKRERRDREMSYLLDFSPLLGDSPDTTPNIVSISIVISIVPSLPSSTPN